MKTPLLPFAAIGLLSLASILSAQPLVTPRERVAIDGFASHSYAGRAAISEGSRRLGEIDSSHARMSVVATMPFSPRTRLLGGFQVQSFSFHPPAGSPIPERLGSVSLKLGVTHALNSRWSLRAEVDPGIYSDFVSNHEAFGAPVGLRIVYTASRELQWAAGVTFDPRSGHPIFGAVGVRWQFAPAWTLALLLPAPAIEWAVTEKLTLFAGGSLRDGTFRVTDNFGRIRGRPELDGEYVDYREIGAGVGATWRLARATTLRLAASRMMDRRFEYSGPNLLLNGNGAPAGQLTVTSAF